MVVIVVAVVVVVIVIVIVVVVIVVAVVVDVFAVAVVAVVFAVTVTAVVVVIIIIAAFVAVIVAVADPDATASELLACSLSLCFSRLVRFFVHASLAGIDCLFSLFPPPPPILLSYCRGNNGEKSAEYSTSISAVFHCVAKFISIYRSSHQKLKKHQASPPPLLPPPPLPLLFSPNT